MKLAIPNAQLSYHLGGTERLISQQINGLVGYPEVDLTLITSITKKPSELYLNLLRNKPKNLRIVELPGMESLNLQNPYNSNNSAKWNLESSIFGPHSLEFLQKNMFDLVVTHFSTDSLYVPENQRNVLHLHGVPLQASDIDKQSITIPELFISDSQYIQNGWVSLYPALSIRQFRVVYPVIDNNRFKNVGLERTIDVLFVGRFISIKGIDDLITAVSLMEKIPKTYLIGDGPNREELKAQISALKIRNIKILSNISDEQLLSIYNSSKVAVFPSYAKEGMVLAMLEAASCGCGIVTSDACSMKEFIEDGESGLIAKSRNPVDLATKLTKLLAQDDLRIKFALNCASKFGGFWSKESRMAELYSVYSVVTQ